MMEARASAISAMGLARAHGGLLAVTALFLLTGALVFDDYGVGVDEPVQRNIAIMAFDNALGRNDNLLRDVDRIYGVVFELPLLFVERALGLEDSRDIYLSRHLLQHLFFLVAGVFCYALVYRLFGSRIVALLAMILFLIHPRLYAASFFNSKDVPFLGMFMIALFFLHRAFRKDTAFAFLLCGVGVGLLVNIRIVGVLLFVVVAGLRLLDFLRASGGMERRRILVTIGVFALFSAGTVYATWPYLWPDPIDRFIESWERFARHDEARNIFEGEFIRASEVPLRYIPKWFAITTPPIILALGVAGSLCILARVATSWRDAPGNTPLRFALLIVLLVVGPVLAVWLIGSLLYDGWRHMYFLYAPFLLLAAFGLQWLLAGQWTILKAGCAVMGVIGVGAALVSAARIHPHQNMYFNALVDRTTPNVLVGTYEMDYYGQSIGPVLRDLFEQYPNSRMLIYSWDYSELPKNRLILPREQRLMVVTRDGFYGDVLAEGREIRELHGDDKVFLQLVGPALVDLKRVRIPGGYPAPVYTLSVYNNAVYFVIEPSLPANHELRLGDHHAMLRAAYRATLDAEPVARSDFDIWLIDRLLVYLGQSCPLASHPLRIDGDVPRFYLHAVPVDPDDLPDTRREYGFENLDFDFWERGGVVDGRCIAAVTLPDYAVAGVRTGQFVRAPAPGSPVFTPSYSPRYEQLWGVEFPVGEAP